MKISALKAYAPQITRYAVALVFLLIGLNQLMHPAIWHAYFPTTLPFGLTVSQAILYNGIFDLTLGILLALGIFTRTMAAISVLHLASIIVVLGYNDVAIRDLGILIAALAVFCHGADDWSLTKRF